MLQARSLAVLLAVGLALTALSIGGYQKYWTVAGRYTTEGIAAGKTKPFLANVRLWPYLVELADGESEARNRHRRQNLTSLVIVAAIPAAVGLAAYWIAAPRRRPEAAADYLEPRGHSIPDGRDRPSP